MQSAIINSCKSFLGKIATTRFGNRYDIPDPYEPHKMGWPLHYVCTDFSFDDLEAIPPSPYRSFARENFFGASLFFGNLTLFGPDKKITRSAELDDWRPISLEFENQFTQKRPYYLAKIGVLNGYHLQFALWLNDKGFVSVIHPDETIGELCQT